MIRLRLRGPSSHRIRRSGHAEIRVAVVLAIVVTLLGLSLAARARRRALECRANLTRMVAALQVYVDDHEGLGPPDDRWPVCLESSVGAARRYDCPAMRGHGPDYEYNASLAEEGFAKVPRPEQAWAFWDDYLRTGEPVYPHTWGLNVAYCDGHVEHVSRDDAPDHVCP